MALKYPNIGFVWIVPIGLDRAYWNIGFGSCLLDWIVLIRILGLDRAYWIGTCLFFRAYWKWIVLRIVHIGSAGKPGSQPAASQPASQSSAKT